MVQVNSQLYPKAKIYGGVQLSFFFSFHHQIATCFENDPSEILAQKWYHCFEYTKRHHMSLLSPYLCPIELACLSMVLIREMTRTEVVLDNK